MSWRAIHFYIHDIKFHTIFLTKYLKPLIAELQQKRILRRYFYIIYWQGGNHIRFRYVSDREQEAKELLIRCYQEFLQSYVPGEVLDEATYYRIYANNKEQVTQLQWVADGQYLEIPYEPEYTRYGGTRALSYSENVFQCSSDYALCILEEAGNRFGVRLFAALDMMRIALKEIEDKEEFLIQYDQFWRKFNGQEEESEASIRKLYEKYWDQNRWAGEGRVSFYDTWQEQLHQNLTEAIRVQDTFDHGKQAKNLILASLLHMNHNRLGIYPRYESILARIMLMHREEVMI